MCNDTDTKKRPVDLRTEGPTVEHSLTKAFKEISTWNRDDNKQRQADRFVELISDLIAEKVEFAVEQAIEMHKDDYDHDRLYD